MRPCVYNLGLKQTDAIQVCDKVLKDPSASDQELFLRAKV